jgi:hypothetical protein
VVVEAFENGHERNCARRPRTSADGGQDIRRVVGRRTVGHGDHASMQGEPYGAGNYGTWCHVHRGPLRLRGLHQITGRSDLMIVDEERADPVWRRQESRHREPPFDNEEMARRFSL